MYSKSEEFCLFAHQIEHEESMSRLYKCYSELFPEVELWKQLESEEKNHAKLIHPIIRKVCDETINFSGELESCDRIKKSIIRLNEEIIKVKNTDIDLDYALRTAIEIEESMVELDFFRSMDTDAPLVEDMLRHIIQETEKHRFALIKTKREFIKEVETKNISGIKRTNSKFKEYKSDIRDKEINLNRELGK